MSKSIITASQISGSLVGTGSFGRVVQIEPLETELIFKWTELI